MSIEINHVQQTEVVAPPAVDVACLVDFKAKANYKYFTRKTLKHKRANKLNAMG